MRTAILGTGIVGRTLAVKLLELGHIVSIGTRDVDKTLSDDTPDRYENLTFKEWVDKNSQAELQTFADAAKEADVLFNCTSGMVSLSALELAGTSNMNGKLLIDVANPLDFSNGMPPSLSIVNTDSLGEQIQKKFSEVRVVKALNTLNAYLMVNPEILKGEHNLFICGNDAEAKLKTMDILTSFGWNADQIIDLGDISNSRATEMLLPLWIRLFQKFGTGEFNFHIQSN